MVEKIDTYEFVKQVFERFPRQKEFKLDTELIHTRFHAAKLQWTDELSDLLFDNKSNFPWSKDVEHCITTLGSCCLFNVLEPHLNTFIIPDRMKNTPNESGVDDKIINEVSKQLQKDLECN